VNKQAIFDEWMGRARKRFEERNPKSAIMYEKTQKYLPGGDTRTSVFFKPYPVFTAEGKGCRFRDVDGHVYIDFLNNYTALIHGHAYPDVVKAVTEQVKHGTVFATPVESQGLLAEMICERVKSVEQVRFINSGSEATMNAIRTARILSGKSKVVKMEGGFHGSHDIAGVSVFPTLEECGPVSRPRSAPSSRGIPKSVLEEVIVVPFNNKEVTEKLIREYQEDIACVIVEPILHAAGMIPQEDGYLEFLRDLTRKLGILLIFDEVISLRLGFGGLQGLYGIEPDLTTFGKIIGGGFPVGAFGASKEIMKIYSPQEKGSIYQSGTFNGNPVTMVAGIANLKALTPDVYERINSLGDSLRRGVDLAFERSGIKGMSMGLGNLSNLHFSSERIRDYRGALRGNFEAMHLVHLGLLERGINIAQRGETSVSTAVTEKEVSSYLTAFEECLAEVKPFIEQTAPNLIQ